MEIFRLVASIYKLVAIKQPLYSNIFLMSSSQLNLVKCGKKEDFSYHHIFLVPRFRYTCDLL